MKLSVFVDKQKSRGPMVLCDLWESMQSMPQQKSEVVVEWVSGLIVRVGLQRCFDVFFY